MRINRNGSKNNVIGHYFKQVNSRKKKQTKLILFGLIMLLVLGLVIYYFVSIRNQKEGFVEDPFAGLDMTNKKEVDAMDKESNVVVIFHKMQGCGHCKTFVPTWKKLAEACNKINNSQRVDDEFDKLYKKAKSSNKKIVCKCVDMIDDLSDDVSGFPELRIYKAKDYVSFNGNRENISELVDFIASNM